MSFSIAGKQAGPIGFGMLGLNRPPVLPYHEVSRVMKSALDNGANFWSAAQYYGTPTANSLHLLNHYFTTYPEDSKKVILSIKGAFSRAGPDNSPDSIRNSVDNCLEVLDGKAFLDIFSPARIDPQVPIEESVRVLVEYIKAGKIGGYGLSECSAATIRRAHSVHPVSAVEIELSLFATDILSNGVAQTCSELKIPLIAYSPLSRGFLTGQIKKLDDIPESDSRRLFPRFQPEVFDMNIKLVEEIEQLANKTGYTMPQVAIAWVTSQAIKWNIPVIPIPGCTTVARVVENYAQVSLKKQELEELSQMVAKMTVIGNRYPDMYQKYVDL
ncbi:NADP-dependent oxidoreductase domain-containing protein [Trichoderma evansii]